MHECHHGTAVNAEHAPDKPKRDKMVQNQLHVVLARFLELESEDEQLLAPVCGLHQVVPLEHRDHLPVWVAYMRDQDI